MCLCDTRTGPAREFPAGHGRRDRLERRCPSARSGHPDNGHPAQPSSKPRRTPPTFSFRVGGAGTKRRYMMARGISLNRLMIIGAVVIVLGIMTNSTAAQITNSPKYAVHTLPLPDNGTGDVSMDYI